MHTKSALYICYFGLHEPLVQTQVLPYLRYLANKGWEIHLLTFEIGWPESFTEFEQERCRADLQASGIRWIARSYAKSHSVFAKLKDIAGGVLLSSAPHAGTGFGSFTDGPMLAQRLPAWRRF